MFPEYSRASKFFSVGTEEGKLIKTFVSKGSKNVMMRNVSSVGIYLLQDERVKFKRKCNLDYGLDYSNVCSQRSWNFTRCFQGKEQFYFILPIDANLSSRLNYSNKTFYNFIARRRADEHTCVVS